MKDMTPAEIKTAMLKAGALQLYLGSKWNTHYDPQAASYSPEIHERHGNRNAFAPLLREEWNRCAAYVTDAEGITTIDESLCNCHKGEWLREPEPWALALLALLDGEQSKLERKHLADLRRSIREETREDPSV